MTSSLLALGLLGGCHPGPGCAQAPCPTGPPAPVEPAGRSPAELEYAALYGEETAPPSVLEPPADAQITASGLTTVVLSSGAGDEHPGPNDQVVMHYTGWSKTGERFASTRGRGQPETIRVSELVDGWREGLRLMVPGEKRRLWIPEILAFGPANEPGKPAGDVVIEVELLEIKPAPEPPKPPASLKQPPRDAQRTESGLAFIVLEAGKGSKPDADSRVTVQYTGWKSDGTMFDSSVVRGAPVTLSLGEVIPGWTEGLQMMREGERRIFWIPAKLAYGKTPERPGVPAGDLVFDIELLKVH